MTPAFRQAIKNKTFKKIPYHTKEKPMIPTFIAFILWLLSLLHSELNWQVILLWVGAILLTIQHWSWTLALLLLALSFGTQNEVLWIKYFSMGAFSIVMWLTFILSSHVSSFSSFAIPSKNNTSKEEKEDDESELWSD